MSPKSSAVPDSTNQTLDAAILARLAPKLPQMTIAQVIKYVVRSTLKQLTNDFEMDFEDLKKTYLEDGADFYEVSAPVGWGAAGAPVTKVPSASTAIVPAKAASAAPTSLSKMKKEDLIRVCQDMGLDIEGTVPELRTRIKDAGGLPSGGLAAAPSGTKSLPSGSKTKSSKPKVPALPAPELTEESMEIVPAKASKSSSTTKSKKKKTLEKPVHTHPIGEDGEASECQVCETYGNPLVAGASRAEDSEEPEESEYVEETKSLRERLNLLLATEMNQDDDDDEEEDLDDQQETQLVEE